MKRRHFSGKGQFSIIAALLVSVVMVTVLMVTYSLVRNSPFETSPQALDAVNEINLALKNLLDYTVGYYGSILQVSGNRTYAQGLTANYISNGLASIANEYPQFNPSFTLGSSNMRINWFNPGSYSFGNLSVTYSLVGLSINNINYSTSSGLNAVFNSVTANQIRITVTEEDGQPVLTLTPQNFGFYLYNNRSSTWTTVHPSSAAAFGNGTYVVSIPSGVDYTTCMVQVTDPRGIMVIVSRVSFYTYTLTWNSLYSSLTNDVMAVEALQNGTLRWLGQDLSTNGKPIPPVPVKALNVNETINGVNREVPFQVEDWESNYEVPLGLASNASVFGNGNMIVFLVSHKVQSVTLWWNGQDTTTQTSYAWTNRYFTDNPATNVLSNGILSLTVGNFKITASIGSTSSSTQFLRINGLNPSYGSSPSYVIYNGIVRDIVQQEAEWSGGIVTTSNPPATANCSNVYSQIYLTFPANATYYTYFCRLMFLNSSQSRTIKDLSVIQLSVSGSSLSPLTENGTSGGYPITSNIAGKFLNFTTPSFQTGWAHHWSEFISSGSSGSGIMFPDNSNRGLYVFDNVAGHKTGALNSISSSTTIEFDPVAQSQYSASFTYPMDINWQGAIVTFNNGQTNTIYPNSGNIGLWVMVENPPKISQIITNNASITINSNPSGSGYIIVDGNPITTPYTFTWTIGSKHTLQALSPVAGPNGTQYVWTGWSDGGAQSHTYTVPMFNSTITATWQTQYLETFNYHVLGSTSGSSAPSVNYTSLGSQHSLTASSTATVWVDSGSTYAYTNNPLTGSNISERWYASSGTSGTISSAYQPINPAYYNQYYLTVNSAYGNPTGQGWYNASSSATFGVTSPASGGTGIRYLFTSWSGSGSGSYNGTSSSSTVTMNNAIKETAQWNTQHPQYQLTMVTNFGTTTPSAGSSWYNSSSTVTISATAPSSGTGERYVWNGWTGSGTGSYTGTNNPATVTMNGPVTETASWTHQWQVTFAISPTGSGTTSPSGTNVWENAGSLSISASANSGYQFSSWSATSGISITSPTSASTTATINAAGTITATFTARTFQVDWAVNATSNTHDGATLTLPAVSANELIVVIYVQDHGHTFTPTDTDSLQWAEHGSQYYDSGQDVYIQEFWAVTSSALSSGDQISPGESGTSSRDTVAIAFGISGANTTSPFDSNYGSPSSGSGTTGAMSVAGATPHKSNDMILGLVGYMGTTTAVTAETSPYAFSLIKSVTYSATDAGGSFKVCAAAEDYVLPSTNAPTVVWGNSPGQSYWAMFVDAIQRAW